LSDDPCRSTAAALRSAGGLAKDQTPVAGCLSADSFRYRGPAVQLFGDPDSALAVMVQVAHDEAAMLLLRRFAFSTNT
jgi:hypothetical protein